MWDNCERHEAKKNELAVESSFSQLSTEFQITIYLGSYESFSMWLMKQKKFIFGHINYFRDELAPPDRAGPGPTRPGHDSLWRVISETDFFS